MQNRQIPVEVNGEYLAEVAGIGEHGEGVSRVDGFTLFVPGALPGEKVRFRVTKVKKQYGVAELLEVVESSPDRIVPRCGVFADCGGCQLQHLSYEGQLRAKRQKVVDCLERIGKLKVAPMDEAVPISDLNDRLCEGDRDNGANEANGTKAKRVENGETWNGRGIVAHPALGMADPWRYRNKGQVPIGRGEGGLVGGFYAVGTHRIVDTDVCLIQHELNDAAVRKVKEIGRRLGIQPYDETTHTGLLRHVVVRTGFRTGEMMVVLVTNGGELPHRQRWIEEIRSELPQVQSICQNINPRRTNVILGDETVVLWGRDFIYDQIGDIRFAISARSFYQVNPAQTEVLYQKALEYAGLTGEETVIDAYSGIGTISLFLARKAKRVLGVEIVREAVEDARRNAQLNGITNVEFAVGKAEEVLPRWKKQGIAADVIVVDPPRKGCEPSLLETMLAMKPKRIVYVSCNPATLARDLRILEDGGYRTVEVQPVDMFPHTTHVECVVWMSMEDILPTLN